MILAMLCSVLLFTLATAFKIFPIGNINNGRPSSGAAFYIGKILRD